jgi:hypothetical protein
LIVRLAPASGRYPHLIALRVPLAAARLGVPPLHRRRPSRQFTGAAAEIDWLPV